ncbi:hypothetical protein [Mesorhizobium sp. dw_380]|nr:hypothetical protein [Mesorhizobium sp. dw_380]
MFEGLYSDRSAIRLRICWYPIYGLSLQGFAAEPILRMGASRPREL